MNILVVCRPNQRTYCDLRAVYQLNRRNLFNINTTQSLHVIRRLFSLKMKLPNNTYINDFNLYFPIVLFVENMLN